MALSVTLSDLKLRSREQADMVNSKFISDLELNRYVNASIKSLYDMLLSAGEFYYIKNYQFTSTDNLDTYPLPDDFYKVLGVDLMLDDQGRSAVTLKPFGFEARNAYLFTPTWNVVGLSYLRYMIQANNIKLAPIPHGNERLRLWYAPIATTLTNETDSFDGINGFEQWVVLDVAMKMLTKEESDITAVAAQRQDIEKRITEMKMMRDYGSPAKISDVTRTQPWEFWSFSGLS